MSDATATILDVKPLVPLAYQSDGTWVYQQAGTTGEATEPACQTTAMQHPEQAHRGFMMLAEVDGRTWLIYPCGTSALVTRPAYQAATVLGFEHRSPVSTIILKDNGVNGMVGVEMFRVGRA